MRRSATISMLHRPRPPCLEALRHLGEVEVHPRGQRLHVAAGHQRAEVPEHHAGQQVQPGVRPHQRGPPVVVQRAPDRGAGRRQRIGLGRDQVELVRLAGAVDVGLHAAPEQYAVVRRLTATARVEGRAVQHDALGPGRQHGRVPLAQGLVVEFEPVRMPAIVRVVRHPSSLLRREGGLRRRCRGRGGTASGDDAGLKGCHVRATRRASGVPRQATRRVARKRRMSAVSSSL